MTRFLIFDRPVAAPHFDLINRDTSPGPVFDLGVDLEGYDGSVFVKIDDIKEMARTLGMLSAEDAKLITDENKSLRAQLNNLPEQTEVLKGELDRVISNFHAGLVAPNDDLVGDDIPKDLTKVNGESELAGQGDLLNLLGKS